MIVIVMSCCVTLSCYYILLCYVILKMEEMKMNLKMVNKIVPKSILLAGIQFSTSFFLLVDVTSKIFP